MLEHHADVCLLLLGFLELDGVARCEIHEWNVNRVGTRRLCTDLGWTCLYLRGIVSSDIIVVLCVLEVGSSGYLLLEPAPIVSGQHVRQWMPLMRQVNYPLPRGIGRIALRRAPCWPSHHLRQLVRVLR